MNQNYENGSAALWWLGQMGLMVRMGSTTLCIDYYASLDESRQTPPPIRAQELRGIDVFLGTHDHLDHIDHESWRIWAKTHPDAKFIFPRKHRKSGQGVTQHNADTQMPEDAQNYWKMQWLFSNILLYMFV